MTIQAGAVDALLRQVDQAFDRRSWHGPNLMGSLRGLKPAVATWRPGEGRNNIAELVVHAAYWKYRACRLISGTTPRSFDLPGSNFIARQPPYSSAELKSDLDLLVSWHRRFRSAVEALNVDRLGDVVTDQFTVADAIAGVAAHDLYHAGQIQLLKRLRESVQGDSA